jgi:hypothetical protein
VPFTLAHPAAILPLRRLAPGMLLPLAVGSIAPDLPYFLPDAVGVPLNRVGHTALGSLTFSLPAGLLLVALLVWLRSVLLEPLWGGYRVVAARAVDEFTAAPRPWLRAVPAVLTGVWLHIAWDSFTHAGAPVVEATPWLRAMVELWPGRPLPVYRVLQYASSILGLVALAAVGWRTHRRVAADDPRRVRAGARPWWLGLVLATSAAVGAADLVRAQLPVSSLYAHATVFLSAAVAAFGVSYVIAGAALAAGRLRG